MYTLAENVEFGLAEKDTTRFGVMKTPTYVLDPNARPYVLVEREVVGGVEESPIVATASRISRNTEEKLMIFYAIVLGALVIGVAFYLTRSKPKKSRKR